AGLLLAATGLQAMQPLIPDAWLPHGGLSLHVAGIGLGLALGVVAALLAAALGVWRSGRITSVDVLREGGRSGLDVRSGRVSRVLVVAQITLATVLLCGAGLFLNTLYHAARAPLGFASDHILTFELSPLKATYPDPAAVDAISLRLVQRLRMQPGVDQAVVVTNLPAGSGPTTQLELGALHAPGGEHFAAQYHGVGADYFTLFAIDLRNGRGFTRRDVRGGENVAVVSESLAKQQYDDRALGKVIEFGSGADHWSARIVGVVGDTHQFGPLNDSPPVVYVPFAQMPDGVMQTIRGLEPLRFALRVKGDPNGYRAMVRKVVAEVAPNQPITSVRSMARIVSTTTAGMRLNLLLVGLFASLSLLLAAAGMYAVVAVSVAAREREFGVRSALGASPTSLLQLVLRNGLVQTAVGLGCGVVAALLLSGILRTAVPQVGQRGLFDPPVIGGVCFVLVMAGLLACLIPALRAARVQPMHALRGE
ncbi:MAG TPA: ABC transporter permease, partial [Oleiagrimonas sp.]|nr:ABC transporter permease [Oleiagrimonas sp.]